ncbi:uncharacterized protein LOC124134641 [Haliotis rufescens]|uniref:uncharacterized protein LOC124134641 n=1 Tax=Haliotis rufescens TaxID=6454 RepID=UPI00201FAF7C|nr:uncharacterized protein LOC124134641 [Haliotis rufescens]
MDLYTTVRYLCTLLIWIMYTTETMSQNSPRWLKSIIHSSTRNKRFSFGYKAETQSPERYLKECCKNNGVCILGSFCQCKKEFYGRYCEYEVRRSWCGPVRHGQWFRSDCSLCRCVQGQSICLEGAYGKCSEKISRKGYKPEDPSNIVKIFRLEEGEDYLENSWADDTSIASSVDRRHPQLTFLALVTLIIGIGVV